MTVMSNTPSYYLPNKLSPLCTCLIFFVARKEVFVYYLLLISYCFSFGQEQKRELPVDYVASFYTVNFSHDGKRL